MEDKKIMGLLEDLQELEEGKESVIDYSQIPVVPMDFDNVMFPEYVTEEFNTGIADVSRIAGQITGLKNIGLSEDGILAVIGMLCDKDMMPTTMEHNLNLAKIQVANFEKSTI